MCGSASRLPETEPSSDAAPSTGTAVVRGHRSRDTGPGFPQSSLTSSARLLPFPQTHRQACHFVVQKLAVYEETNYFAKTVHNCILKAGGGVGDGAERSLSVCQSLPGVPRAGGQVEQQIPSLQACALRPACVLEKEIKSNCTCQIEFPKTAFRPPSSVTSTGSTKPPDRSLDISSWNPQSTPHAQPTTVHIPTCRLRHTSHSKIKGCHGLEGTPCPFLPCDASFAAALPTPGHLHDTDPCAPARPLPGVHLSKTRDWPALSLPYLIRSMSPFRGDVSDHVHRALSHTLCLGFPPSTSQHLTEHTCAHSPCHARP